MTLIIEDGSIVANANSFVTDAELVIYAAGRGLTIPATESDREPLLMRAMDYLAGVESDMQGVRISSEQVLSFPRNGVYINDFIVNSDTIPKELKNSQMELAIQANTDELLINDTVSNLSGFNVDGVYSESYFKGGSKSQIRTGRADVYLDLLLVDTNKLVRT